MKNSSHPILPMARAMIERTNPMNLIGSKVNILILSSVNGYCHTQTNKKDQFITGKITGEEKDDGENQNDELHFLSMWIKIATEIIRTIGK